MRNFHGGTKTCKLDFSANINPLGLHPAAQRAFSSLSLSSAPLARYPDSDCTELREQIAQFWHCGADSVVCAAGAADLIFAFVQTFSFGSGACARKNENAASGAVVVLEPAFTEYERASSAHGLSVRHLLLSEQNGFAFTKDDMPRLSEELEGAHMLFAASPANPSGAVLPPDVLCKIAALCEEKNVFFVLDACFCQFSESAEQGIRNLISRRAEFPHTVILNAFTKFYGMAGLRLGYALCFSEKTAVCLRNGMRPWAVGAAELAAGSAVLREELSSPERRTLSRATSLSSSDMTRQSSWEKHTRALIEAERARLSAFLRSSGFSVVAGEANFILFRADASSLPGGAFALAQSLLSLGIAVRPCADFYGLTSNWFRVAVRTPEENTRLIESIASVCGRPVQTISPAKHTAAIMLQGTMSNAGKSLLVAALCRIFREDGYRVAPFKSQNMALNSGVTVDGLEMGRAQIMQAEAAGILPDVRMNPILLKPTGDHTSQVIVNGEPVGTMTAQDYFSFRTSLIPQISAAYNSLAEENDIIVIEGAGSPAEINLKKDDIVNMGLAELVDAPVLLAGDIDRGGVFASLYGTVALLEQKERERIKGFVINKFRGDVSLLQGGLDQIHDLTGIPVLGVVPWIENLRIDDEDSLCDMLSCPANAILHIAVVRLPFISNFTDIRAFSRLPFVRVSFFADFDEYAAAVTEWGEPDMFILPGTKNTVHALKWLRSEKLDRLIVRKAKSGVPVIGICGGFQLLGIALHDEDGNEDESAEKGIPALALLPVETTFTPEKTRVQVNGTLPKISGLFAPLSDCALRGYEIHHGRTVSAEDTCGGKDCSLLVAQKNVLGTYVHGFFDSDEIIRAILMLLCDKKDETLPPYESYASEREAECDRLADIVRASLDMDAIYKILGIRRAQ